MEALRVVSLYGLNTVVADNVIGRVVELMMQEQLEEQRGACYSPQVVLAPLQQESYSKQWNSS
jgi:hypothetical protein